MKINGIDFTIGADPELFIGLDGKPHSAFGLIEGDKRRPVKVDKGAVQVDGMALEFNIDPASTEDDFADKIMSVQRTILSMVPQFHLIHSASVVFDKEHFKAQPRVAKMLGCDPDFNGWTGSDNQKPNGKTTMRTAGGHVHIGGLFTDNIYDPIHFDMCRDLAMAMDAEVGIYSVLFDKDDKRRSMYGQAGCFRPKVYGMEYRTMSNAWIFNEKLTRLVYQFTGDAIRRMVSGEAPNPEVQNIINTSDRDHTFFKNNKKADMILEVIGG